MMSDHSPSMGDEVFMTRKSESGKTKNVDLRETTKSGFSAFWKQALHLLTTDICPPPPVIATPAGPVRV